MTRPTGIWSVQQLAEFLVAVSAHPDAESALQGALEWAAEALDAQVGVISTESGVVSTVGFAAGQVPEQTLIRMVRDRVDHVELDGIGACRVVHSDIEGQQAGTLSLARAGDAPFNADEVTLLHAMACSLGLTLAAMRNLERERALRAGIERQAEENQRLIRELAERQTLFERLSRIEADISRRAPLREVLDSIIVGAAELLGDEVAGLRLIDPLAPDHMTMVSSVGIGDELLERIRRTPVGNGIGGRAIVENRLVVSTAYPTDSDALADYVEDGLQSAMAAPVHENGRVVGSITTATHRAGRTYSGNEQAVLLAFGHHASMALNDAKALDAMRHLAYHDPLTALPNRSMFAEHVRQALVRVRRGQRSVAVLFLDLDRFKIVNDSLGHDAGDRLLISVAQRLRGCLRLGDLAARLGGDEFAILVEGDPATADETSVAQRVLDELRTPFVIDGRELSINASIGMAVSAAGADTTDALLRNADLAMYRAKLEGGGRYSAFESGMHIAATQRVDLESELHHAVVDSDFVLEYQPVIELATGTVRGVEALLRWRRPSGLLSPADFVPVAEEVGLIVPIGRWVLHEAMAQVHQWREMFPEHPDLGVSVNISALQLQQPDLVLDVLQALVDTDIDPRSLTLEITESALMRDTALANQKLHHLKRLGIRLALDDFGTGYSSIGYLRQFPIDVLKIDRSFIKGLPDGVEETALARAIIDFGRALRLDLIAEGIERADQLAGLQRLGCAFGQGYHLARPMTADAMETFLATDYASVKALCEATAGRVWASGPVVLRDPAEDPDPGDADRPGIASH